MKGIVFTEFMDMVEDKFSPEMVDTIIEESDLASGGAYTSVGTYDYREIMQMVTRLSEHSGIPASQLVETFGRHLVGRFYALYPSFFSGIKDVFSFLLTIEQHVHVEVKKLYPDAELPHFDTQLQGDNVLVMHYQSFRPLADLAAGLIEGAIAHFNESVAVERQPQGGVPGCKETFILRKV